MRELHLFAGAGGGILGGMLLGHTPVGAVEIDPFARAVLQARQADGSLPDFPIYEDVRDFDGTAWRDRVDIIAGGFPCQDLSCAGKGAGIDGARSGLWWEMLRVIREARPSFVFLENVPAITGRGLDRVLGSLADLGFNAEWCVLSAADCGAPHLRKRWWCLARNTARNDAISQCCISERPHAQSAGDGATMADSESRQNVGRERGSLDGSPEAGESIDPASVASGQAVADSNRGCSNGSQHQVQTGRHKSGAGGQDDTDAGHDQQEIQSCNDVVGGEFGQRATQRRRPEQWARTRAVGRTADGNGSEGTSGNPAKFVGKSCSGGLYVSDSNRAGCEQQRSSFAASAQRDAAERSGAAHSDCDGMPGCAAGPAETESRVGRAADGLAAWLDAGRRLHGTAWQEGWESDCPRTVTGKPANRTNRLKALGNGQVPQTAAAAFRLLWERLHA